MFVTRPLILVALTATLLSLPGCKKGADAGNVATAGAVSGPLPSPGGGWAEQVAETPEGGFRMGNPDARAKLVEYASYTCPHCAEFDAESAAEIRQMVATGKLSYELRNFVRDPYDLTAALLVRCGGPGPFFKLTDEVFAAQQEWIGNVQNMTPADQEKIRKLPVQQQFPALATAMGLNSFFGQRGIPEAKARQCLANQAEQQKLVDMNKAAVDKYQIEGTPTFLLDGEVIGSMSWAALKTKLAAAMGG